MTLTKDQIELLIQVASEDDGIEIEVISNYEANRKMFTDVAALIDRALVQWSDTEALRIKITWAGLSHLVTNDAEISEMFPCIYADDWTLTPPDKFDGLGVRS